MDNRAVILDAIGRVAPDADTGGLVGDDDLREVLELDSMDFLNVVTAVCERLGIEIPERDYNQLVTLDAFTGYLDARVPA